MRIAIARRAARAVPTRLRIAVHALRGRPVCYRCSFVGEVYFAPHNPDMLAIENTFKATANEAWGIRPQERTK